MNISWRRLGIFVTDNEAYPRLEVLQSTNQYSNILRVHNSSVYFDP